MITAYGVWNEKFAAGTARSDSKIYHLRILDGKYTKKTLCGKSGGTWTQTDLEKEDMRVCSKCEDLASDMMSFGVD